MVPAKPMLRFRWPNRWNIYYPIFKILKHGKCRKSPLSIGREQLFLLFCSEALNNPHMIELYQSEMSSDIITVEAILFIHNMMVNTGIF